MQPWTAIVRGRIATDIRGRRAGSPARGAPALAGRSAGRAAFDRVAGGTAAPLTTDGAVSRYPKVLMPSFC